MSQQQEQKKTLKRRDALANLEDYPQESPYKKPKHTNSLSSCLGSKQKEMKGQDYEKKSLSASEVGRLNSLKNLENDSLLEGIEPEEEIKKVYGINTKKGNDFHRVYFTLENHYPGRKPIKMANSFRWTQMYIESFDEIPSVLGQWVIGKAVKGENEGKYYKSLKNANGTFVKQTFKWIEKKIYKMLKKEYSEGEALETQFYEAVGDEDAADEDSQVEEKYTKEEDEDQKMLEEMKIKKKDYEKEKSEKAYSDYKNKENSSFVFHK